MARNANWTDREIAYLVRAWADGARLNDMVAHLGRTRSAIKNYAYSVLRLPHRSPQATKNRGANRDAPNQRAAMRRQTRAWIAHAAACFKRAGQESR